MNRLSTFVLVACGVILVIGVVQLFALRFESGDVYPPYSTLRSDPLGAMALYESLGQLPGVSVERDFSPDNQLPEGREITYLHLGGEPTRWRALPEDLFREIDQFVARGGRLVV